MESPSKSRTSPEGTSSKDEVASGAQTDVLGNEDCRPVGVATHRGGKPSQEDAYFIGSSLPERMTLNGYSSSMVGCFGVFDGHGGDRASKYCAENLFSKIQEEFDNSSKVDEAIVAAVRDIDNEFIGVARQSVGTTNDRGTSFQASMREGTSHVHQLEDGTTALVAVVRSKILYVGNVGDSRAILATRDGKAKWLSRDQKPSRPDERERLEAKGATVTGHTWFLYHLWPFYKFLDVPRVNGALAMSRSVGDIALKDYITCDPEITTHPLRSNDHYLIMATDGLWDVVSTRKAAKVASKCNSPQEAADALLKLAMDRKTPDNVTVLIIDLTCYPCEG